MPVYCATVKVHLDIERNHQASQTGLNSVDLHTKSRPSAAL